MPKRVLSGVIVKKSSDKTVKVVVVRRVKLKILGKVVSKKKSYLTHDPENAYNVGDEVQIIESKPISRNKRWTVLRKVS